MKRPRLFALFLFLRLSSVFVVQTAHVPDEYWQSLEVAHKLAFGYGHLTWEWNEGLRSYFYPAVISFLYKAAEFIGLDAVIVLTLLPRILQAVISSIADFYFWLWVCEQTGSQGNWAAFSVTTSWFWFYCSSRTLTNTLETAFTAIALYFYPWQEKVRKGSFSFLWLVGFICACRPTAAIIWLPLCGYHIFFSQDKKKLLLTEYLPITIVVAALTTLVDSYFYGRLIFTPWNFLKANIFSGVGSFYGSNPWYWYFTQGVPTVLGLHLVPFLLGVWKIVESRKFLPETVLLSVIVFTVFIYSLLPHKEFRFILPLLPMLLYISSGWLSRWSRTASRLLLWIVAVMLFVGFLVPAGYFGLFHQRGTLDAMSFLAKESARNETNTRILILTPCHATPLYSHLHVNVPVRFLTCEPNFSGVDDYLDEADIFYQDPKAWLKKEFPTKSSVHPSHVVTFDVLQGHMKNFFAQRNFTLVGEFFHAHWTDGRYGQKVLVHQLRRQ